jgi:hypothetical protein
MISAWHEHHEQNVLAAAPERKKNAASVQEEYVFKSTHVNS